MTSIRSFAAPHKGLRNIIARFSLLAGQTDFSDPGQLDLLQALGREMFTLLKDHVHTENEYTLKHLEERVKGASKHDLHDHEELEAIQEALERQLEALDGTQTPDEAHGFYLEFSAFHSRYLEHIYHEETVTEKQLQAHFTNDELIRHRIEIMRQIGFHTLLLWLKYIIPAQKEEENISMLSGLRTNAPGEAFEKVLATIRPEMTEEQYASLISKLVHP